MYRLFKNRKRRYLVSLLTKKNHSKYVRVIGEWTKALGLSLLVLALFILVSTAYGEPFTDSQKRFSAYRERAFQLQSNVNTKYLTGELNTLNQWIKQAERFLRAKDEDQFMKTVKLVQVQLRLVDMSLEELDAREQILKLHEEAKRMETKAKNERESVVELEKMMGGSLTSMPIKKANVQVPKPTMPNQAAPQPNRGGVQ
jgi:hypothetical protein